MRYLLTADDGEPFAYAPGRRDFFRASDDVLWAHESHDWLIEAGTGKLLAHRTGDTYYGVERGERLYRAVAEYTAPSLDTGAPADRSAGTSPRSRRTERRGAPR
jgi:hypothetical protein